MGKLVTTPQEWKRFTGSVEFKDPIPLDAVLAYEEALSTARPQLCMEARKLREDETESGRLEFLAHFTECITREEPPHCKPGLGETAAQIAMLPAVLLCVEKWSIEGVPEYPTAATFPGTPRASAHKLMGWLINQISEIYIGEELDKADPNA